MKMLAGEHDHRRRENGLRHAVGVMTAATTKMMRSACEAAQEPAVTSPIFARKTPRSASEKRPCRAASCAQVEHFEPRTEDEIGRAEAPEEHMQETKRMVEQRAGDQLMVDMLTKGTANLKAGGAAARQPPDLI
jgi:hypothetical protein